MKFVFLLTFSFGSLSYAAFDSTCQRAAERKIVKQFDSVKNLAQIKKDKGRINYAYNVEVSLCRLEKAENVIPGKKWRRACPKKPVENRSACVRDFIKNHPPRSGASLLKLTELITLASTADRDEVIKSKKAKPWASLFGVQATQNMAYLLLKFKLENFYYYSMEPETAEIKNLIRVEEGPLRIALNKLAANTSILNKNYRASYQKQPPADEKTKAWVFDSLTNVGKILEEHENRTYKWRLSSGI